MSLQTIIQRAAKRLLINNLSTVIGNSDNNAIFLLALLEQSGKDIRDCFPWPEMVKEYTFTLATNTASYAYPADLNLVASNTFWNRSQMWPLIGPVNATMWQQYKSGLIATLPRQRFRPKGWGTAQLFIDPTPSSAENGQTMAYEYLSKTWIRPKTWVASTSWTGIQYCSYNGNIYDRQSTAAATTGTSAPVHTSGTISDGSISWTYSNAAYETFVHDSDEVILDNAAVEDGLVWRFKMEKGLEFEGLKKLAEDNLEIMKTALLGSSVLDMRSGSGLPPVIGPWSYPQANFGL